MAKIFVSHSSIEADLARYFASWLEKVIPGTKCYCSSRPTDLPPGTNWLEDIVKNASQSDVCLLLLSPNTANNNWLHFEAGIILGANSKNKIVPTIYGGMSISKIPSTIRHLQSLVLHEQTSFDAFVQTQIPFGMKPKPSQNYSSFINGMDSASLRLLKYGEFALIVSQSVQIGSLNPMSLNQANDRLILQRSNHQGTLVGVRTTIVPRRLGHIQHWKFGILLRDSSTPRLFQFHSGCHEGFNTWILYSSPILPCPISIPARLEMERSSTLELWLTANGQYAYCVGIDCDGNRIVILNDRGETRWRLMGSSWNEIEIGAWADGLPFQIDIEKIEIDRIP